MPIHNLNFFDLSYISTDDPDGFSDNGGYQFDWGVSTVTITPGATETVVSVEDIDTFFDDDQDANQTLNGAATLNGTSYPDGTWIQAEYRIVVEDSLGNTYDMQFVSVGTDAYNIEGFVIQGPVPPFGEALTVVSSSDFPSGTYAYSTSSPACFGPKSRIATRRGHIPAKKLRKGDHVILPSGDTAMVELVLASTATETTRDGAPIRIRKDAFGPGQPKRDLILSPQHRVWVPQLGALVAAKALVVLPRVGRMKSAGKQDLIHVVLRTHEVLLAEGLACESYWPGRTALAMLPPTARRQVRRIMGRAEPAMPFMKVQEAMQRLKAASLTAPVGGISEGREQERDVVMRVGVGHAEPDRDHVEEERISPGLPRGAQVIPGGEVQFIRAGGKGFGRQNGAVGPPVIIRDHGDDLAQRALFDPEEGDRHSGGRCAGGSIEDMGGQVSLGHDSSVPVVGAGCAAWRGPRFSTFNTNTVAAALQPRCGGPRGARLARSMPRPAAKHPFRRRHGPPRVPTQMRNICRTRPGL
jgi:hypothetical protein